jgi:hypothetical protein
MKVLLVLIAAIVIPGGFVILAASFIGRRLAKRQAQTAAASCCN